MWNYFSVTRKYFLKAITQSVFIKAKNILIMSSCCKSKMKIALLYASSSTNLTHDKKECTSMWCVVPSGQKVVPILTITKAITRNEVVLVKI